MKIIRLTSLDGRPVYIGFHNMCVMYVINRPQDDSIITLTNICFRAGLFWEVKESPEQILAMNGI